LEGQNESQDLSAIQEHVSTFDQDIMILHKIPFQNSINDSMFCLELALAVGPELSSSTGNSGLASLLDLGLEDDLVALAPHLSDNCLTRDDNTSEADLDVLERTEALVDSLSGNTEAAEAVENGGLEATNLGKLGIDVERARNVSYVSDKL
jgi:hypothetical protein